MPISLPRKASGSCRFGSVALLAIALALSSCGELQTELQVDSVDPGGTDKASYLSGKADNGEWIEGDPVRLALAQVQEDLPEKDYWSLLSENQIDSVIEADDDAKLSGFVRKGVLIGLSRKTRISGKEALRSWTYNIGADIEPSKINSEDGKGTIAFKIKAGSKVEFARAFDSAYDANKAKAPTLMDLPHDSDSALSLPEGMVVSLPIQAKVAVDVTGRFLTAAANFSRNLESFLSTSVMGTTSGTRQGTLVVEGGLMLQVIRLGTERVRLRIISERNLEAKGALNLGAFGTGFYRFFPSSFIDRARAIKTRIEEAKQKVQNRINRKERFTKLRNELPDTLDMVLNATGLPQENEAGKKIRELAEKTTDGALDIAKDSVSIQTLEDQALNRADEVLETTISAIETKIEPTTNAIQRLSTRTYQMNGIVLLSDDFKRKVRTVADYEFDLSSSEARRAFDRAISGRALWMDKNDSLETRTLKHLRLSDLTLAEDIASLDATNETPRVIRKAAAIGDFRERRFQAHLSGLWMSTNLSWSQKKNRIELIDEDGIESYWEARAWEFGRHVGWIGDNTASNFASGAFLTQGEEDLSEGGYWFSWNETHAKSTWKPVAESLAEFINLLGPIAVDSGIAELYEGEFYGRVHAKLDVVFSGEAMNYLFDPEVTTDAVLWQVFAEVAESFDNRFGLPMLMSPFRPRILKSIEGGELACEKIAYHFGGHYCFFFANKFVPALRKAQFSEDPAERLAFLEKFYRKGFFANPIGSRLMVRYISSLMHHFGLNDELSIRATIRNEEDNSESASPTLELGDPEAFALIENMSPEGLK